MSLQAVQVPQRPFEIEVFFDGGCPLCRREIDLLKRWDRQQKIIFTDIDACSSADGDLEKTHDELMAQMHGRLPDGTWVQGVEVFRRMYSAVGFGRLVWLSRWPLVSHLLDLGYRVFARHRLRLTGRCTGTCAVQPANKKPIA